MIILYVSVLVVNQLLTKINLLSFLLIFYLISSTFNVIYTFQAEVRLVGDEALNRAVVGGFAFHSHKTNIILQNQIDSTKNAR